jgi:hypothetical protein
VNKLIVIVATLTTASLAHADVNFASVDDGTHVVSVTTGAEHGLVLGAGYARMLSVKDQPILVRTELALQWAEVDVSDFKLRAGALVPIVGNDRWKVIGGVTAIVRGTDNDIARMINAGADAAVLAGYYRPRWFAALEGGFDWALATHIDHSDEYRMSFEGARDGWYHNAGGILRYGVQAGVSFAGNDIILRAGKLQDAMLPFYATLAYDRRF